MLAPVGGPRQGEGSQSAASGRLPHQTERHGPVRPPADGTRLDGAARPPQHPTVTTSDGRADEPHIAALHQQGIHALQSGDLPVAGAAFEQALALAPDSVDLLTCAALVAVRMGDSDRGLERYRRALRLDARHREALCGYGAALQQRGEMSAARAAFAVCVDAHPGFAAGWCNLGGAAAALGMLREAEAAYRRSVGCAPAFAAGHLGLLWVLTTSGQVEARGAAVRAFAEACPEHPTAAHLLRSLAGGQPPDRCSPAFVAQHFDDFAPDYDLVLRRLGTAVADELAAIWRQQGVVSRRALDLGCGTGSGSGWLRAPGRRILGVDLSRAMLERARRTGLYEELHNSDAMVFLAATAERFDAAVLADVLPYFGELAPLLAALARCLEDGGHALASFESAAQPGFQLAPTGRFQHHPDAVRAAAEANGFDVEVMRAGVLRREGGKPVDGGYVLLRRRG